MDIKDGKLNIVKEGQVQKFRKHVREKTFGAATAGQRSIMYVTERAVFQLVPGRGIELLEVAPGIDIEKDVAGSHGVQAKHEECPTHGSQNFRGIADMAYKLQYCYLTAIRQVIRIVQMLHAQCPGNA